jgi:sulfur carrier protein
MELTINGEKHRIDDAGMLVDVLRHVGVAIDRGGLAVAVNDQVVPKTQWDRHEVHPGDRIEVIHAVQGG